MMQTCISFLFGPEVAVVSYLLSWREPRSVFQIARGEWRFGSEPHIKNTPCQQCKSVQDLWTYLTRAANPSGIVTHAATLRRLRLDLLEAAENNSGRFKIYRQGPNMVNEAHDVDISVSNTCTLRYICICTAAYCRPPPPRSMIEQT
jgi:hypothetical protein